MTFQPVNQAAVGDEIVWSLLCELVITPYFQKTSQLVDQNRQDQTTQFSFPLIAMKMANFSDAMQWCKKSPKGVKNVY